jgi:hypothetical protein
VEALEVISHNSDAARGGKAIIHTPKPPDNPASKNAVSSSAEINAFASKPILTVGRRDKKPSSPLAPASTNKGSQEILWVVAEAANLPVIWATQVLESLAKKRVPSRSEITDAAVGQRAYCVMLNKGPCAVKAVGILHDILRRMQAHQEKRLATAFSAAN